MTTEVQQAPWAHDLRPATRWWYIILLVPILAVMAFAIFQPIQVLPRIALAPAYTAMDQDGARLTSEDMRGGLTLYTFAHSNCVAPCVSTNETRAGLRPLVEQIDLNGIPLRFVTLYVDPENATPEVLRAQATALKADTEQWRFATGDPAMLKSVIGAGFRTYFGKDDSGRYTVDPVFVLVDGWGIVRATYRLGRLDASIFERDLGLIVKEARNSTGVNRYAYEAAHLFMCYPK
jgi:protein SCO1/2